MIPAMLLFIVVTSAATVAPTDIVCNVVAVGCTRECDGLVLAGAGRPASRADRHLLDVEAA